mmetsp:Transcript_18993/g.58519  ORF Transcript_18993/g.58519 Transcript_18993/m.58519 type:complete len:339 (-) Transcript_18993:34-1050(-)
MPGRSAAHLSASSALAKTTKVTTRSSSERLVRWSTKRTLPKTLRASATRSLRQWYGRRKTATARGFSESSTWTPFMVKATFLSSGLARSRTLTVIPIATSSSTRCTKWSAICDTCTSPFVPFSFTSTMQPYRITPQTTASYQHPTCSSSIFRCNSPASVGGFSCWVIGNADESSDAPSSAPTASDDASAATASGDDESEASSSAMANCADRSSPPRDSAVVVVVVVVIITSSSFLGRTSAWRQRPTKNINNCKILLRLSHNRRDKPTPPPPRASHSLPRWGLDSCDPSLRSPFVPPSAQMLRSCLSRQRTLPPCTLPPPRFASLPRYYDTLRSSLARR